MADAALLAPTAKFSDPDITAKGEPRARVALGGAPHALAQYRQPVQHHLPQLLHRIEPRQRPARLSHPRRGGRLPRRDRARRLAGRARSASPAASRS